MPITPNDVRQIATLARLRLGPAEVGRMAEELGSILSHMRELAEVDVEGAAPMGGVSDHPAPLRGDDEGADPLHRPVEALAPALEERFFLVPRLAAMDGDAPVELEEGP